MNRGGISDRLIQLSTLLVGRIRGGTAYAAIVASVLFAGISGTAIADIAALGQIFINSMPKEGYRKAFAAALVTAGSIIGPLVYRMPRVMLMSPWVDRLESKVNFISGDLFKVTAP